MSYNTHYHTMTISTALEIFLATEEFHGIRPEDEFEITSISDTEFNIKSISKDPMTAFDFDLRIYVDPVVCAITYDVYRTTYGDTGKIVLTDITYDQAR